MPNTKTDVRFLEEIVEALADRRLHLSDKEEKFISDMCELIATEGIFAKKQRELISFIHETIIKEL